MPGREEKADTLESQQAFGVMGKEKELGCNNPPEKDNCSPVKTRIKPSKQE